MSPDDVRHGTNAGYIAGCRCDACKPAHSRYRADLRKRQYLNRGGVLVPGAGTRRRIQALMAMGHSLRKLDAHLGMRPTYCHKLLRGTGTVTRDVAERASALYERLSMTLPDTSTPDLQRIVTRTRKVAAQKGYKPPLAWDDIDALTKDLQTDHIHIPYQEADRVVVDRVLAGDFTIVTTKYERVEVVRRWSASQRSLAELERLSGWNVHRYARQAAA